MKQEFEDQIRKRFPSLCRDYGGDMTQTCMAWGFEIGDGWFAILWDACEKLEALGKPSLYFTQVKEKFGTLQLYMSGYDDDVSRITREAEEKSAETCETCGAAGVMRGPGWYFVACDEHSNGRAPVRDAGSEEE